MNGPTRGDLLVVLALAVVSGSAFATGILLGIEWTDEGQLVYGLVRASQGALPYRDFHHLYGPSFFFLHAPILRLIGGGLETVRWAMVGIKALDVALLYLAARTVAARPAAALTALLAVGPWSAPWFAFEAPYAHYYATAAMLVGWLVVLACPARPLSACLLAGLLWGVASTFKQTTGVLTLFAFALFALWSVPVGAASSSPGPRRAVATALGLAIIVAVAVIAGAYLARRNSLANAAVLGGPLAALLAGLAWRTLRVDGSRPVARVLLGRLAAVAVGFALPPAGYAVYYAGQGALRALVDDTLLDLPRAIEWFAPYPAPSWRGMALLAASAAVLACLRRRRANLAVALAAVAVTVLLFTAGAGRRWYADVFALQQLAPLALAWAAVTTALPALVGAPTATGAALAMRVWTPVAAVSLLFLHPHFDLWHVLIGLPAFLPLLAHYIDAAVSASPRPRRGGLAIVLLAALWCGPGFQALTLARAATPASNGFARAPHIADPTARGAAAAQLLRFLDTGWPGAALCVPINEQMLYVLSGRRSGWEQSEFMLYLVGADAVTRDAARARVSDVDLVQQLQRECPLVVVARNQAMERFAATYPVAAAYLREHYRPLRTFPPYQVLERMLGSIGPQAE